MNQEQFNIQARAYTLWDFRPLIIECVDEFGDVYQLPVSINVNTFGTQAQAETIAREFAKGMADAHPFVWIKLRVKPVSPQTPAPSLFRRARDFMEKWARAVALMRSILRKRP